MKRISKARNNTTEISYLWEESAQTEWSQQQIKGVRKQLFIRGREEEREWKWSERGEREGGEVNIQAIRRKKKIYQRKRSGKLRMLLQYSLWANC